MTVQSPSQPRVELFNYANYYNQIFNCLCVSIIIIIMNIIMHNYTVKEFVCYDKEFGLLSLN